MSTKVTVSDKEKAVVIDDKQELEGSSRDILPKVAGLPIITSSERALEKRGIKGCILGKAGIGKTSLLWTLEAETTLLVDLEAGDLAIQGWQGDVLRPRSWPECRDLAVYLSGPSPSAGSSSVYGSMHYEAILKKFGPKDTIDKYNTIFIDSITVAGRLCLQWCKNQPQALSNRNGKEDMRFIYQMLALEMINWLMLLQQARDKHIWFIGVLEEKIDEFNNKNYGLQIDGNKVANELPAIVDQLITMTDIKNSRAFVNQTINPYSLPAKDRSGQLEILEEAHLGKLMDKIIRAEKMPRNEQLTYKLPIT